MRWYYFFDQYSVIMDKEWQSHYEGVLENIKSNGAIASCPYGSCFLSGGLMIANICRRNNRVKPKTTTLEVKRETIINVCKKYLIEFDMCLIQRTAKANYVANEIRKILVFIIREYLDQPTLTDDGDINKLRIIINK